MKRCDGLHVADRAAEVHAARRDRDELLVVARSGSAPRRSRRCARACRPWSCRPRRSPASIVITFGHVGVVREVAPSGRRLPAHRRPLEDRGADGEAQRGQRERSAATAPAPCAVQVMKRRRVTVSPSKAPGISRSAVYFDLGSLRAEATTAANNTDGARWLQASAGALPRAMADRACARLPCGLAPPRDRPRRAPARAREITPARTSTASRSPSSASSARPSA